MAVEIRMPQLTLTMSEAKVVRWCKREGEEIEKGQPLLEVETDKAAVEIEAVASGYVLKVLAQEGEVVKVDELLAVIGQPGEEIKLAEPSGPAAVQPETAATSANKVAGPAVIRRRAVSPAARRKAEAAHIDINRVVGTGPDGLVTEKDVLQFMEQTALKPGVRQSKYGEEEVVPLSGIRKAMAERVDLSRKTVAQTTTFAEVDMTEVLDRRRKTQMPVTSYVLRAAIIAIKDFPLVNSSLVDNNIILKKYINLGVAVSTDQGLVVPVIHNAEAKTIEEIAKRVEELAEKARRGQLALADVSDGTFSVTNSGVFGSLFFAPIINYPESAIIGMGKVMKMPVVRDDQIVIRSMMHLSLSYDHRVIDGATAVSFLQRVKQVLEVPEALA